MARRTTPWGPTKKPGAAYVFGQSGTSWPLQDELTAGDGAAFDAFGTSVSVSGPNAFVGAPYHTAGGHSEAGAAYVFAQSGTTWSQQSELTASDGKLADLFGFSVSVSGTSAIIGAYQHDVSGTVSACRGIPVLPDLSRLDPGPGDHGLRQGDLCISSATRWPWAA